MLKSILTVCLCAVCTGCTQVKQVQHLSELLTLKAYSEEKEGQEKEIEAANARLDLLKRALADGSLKSYKQNAIVKTFGLPVLKDSIVRDGQTVESWLYRHPIQKYATDRVYLYFDAAENLVDSELVSAP